MRYRIQTVLGVMELIGECEPCLAKHLYEFGEKGPRKPSYLSSTKCEEVIGILSWPRITTLLGVIPLKKNAVKSFPALANRVGEFGHKVWSQNIVQFHSQNKFQNFSNCIICNIYR